MKYDVFQNVQNGKNKHRHEKRWLRVISALECAVVLFTTYAVAIPAMTMEEETFCGVEEHKHVEECYEQTSEVVLNCTFADDNEGAVIIHKHDNVCYDAEGNLVCPLEEKELHTHTDVCLAETEADETIPAEKTLICIQDTEEHVHDDETCYKTVYTCAIDVDVTGEPADEHEHNQDCTEKVLTCTIHTHNDDCYASAETGEDFNTVVEPEYVCGKTELKLHIHGVDCDAENCDQTKVLEHVHSGLCLDEEEAEPILICTKTVHSHSDECYVDPNAETAAEPALYTYTEGSMTVTVQLPENSEVSKNAELIVTPIVEGDDEYGNYIDKVEETIEGEAANVLLYDISFCSDNGIYIPVSDTAKVSIAFTDDSVDPDAEIAVIHFAGDEEEPVVVDDVTVGAEDITVEEEFKNVPADVTNIEAMGQIVAQQAMYSMAPADFQPQFSETKTATVVEFTTDGFSVFAVVEINAERETIVTKKLDNINNLDGKTVMISTAGAFDLQNSSDVPKSNYALVSVPQVYSGNNHLSAIAIGAASGDGTITVTSKNISDFDKILWEVSSANGGYQFKAKGTEQYLYIDNVNQTVKLQENPSTLYVVQYGGYLYIATEAGTALKGRELSLNPEGNDGIVTFASYGNTGNGDLKRAQLVISAIPEIPVTDLDGKTYAIVSVRDYYDNGGDLYAVTASSDAVGDNDALGEFKVNKVEETIDETHTMHIDIGDLERNRVYWKFTAVDGKPGVYYIESLYGGGAQNSVGFMHIGNNTYIDSNVSINGDNKPQEITVVAAEVDGHEVVGLYATDGSKYYLNKFGGDGDKPFKGYTSDTSDLGSCFVLAVDEDDYESKGDDRLVGPENGNYNGDTSHVIKTVDPVAAPGVKVSIYNYDNRVNLDEIEGAGDKIWKTLANQDAYDTAVKEVLGLNTTEDVSDDYIIDNQEEVDELTASKGFRFFHQAPGDNENGVDGEYHDYLYAKYGSQNNFVNYYLIGGAIYGKLLPEETSAAYTSRALYAGAVLNAQLQDFPFLEGEVIFNGKALDAEKTNALNLNGAEDGPGRFWVWNVGDGNLNDDPIGTPDIRDMVSVTLHDGYPYLVGGTNFPKGSLDYLYAPDSVFIEGTMQDGGGLFQRDEDGYWYYHSELNAAYYDKADNEFVLYDHAVRPNYITENAFDRELGNFLPFDSLGEVSDGTVDWWTEDGDNNNDLDPEGFTPLDNGEDPVGVSDNNKFKGDEHFKWDDFDEYFEGKNSECENSNGVCGAALADTNLSDMWFGMMIEIPFIMPKDGKVLDANGNLQDMIFSFSGDDDVFVYIDDVLILNIGNIHGEESGFINFATGEFNNVDGYNIPDMVDGASRYPNDFATRFKAAGKTNDVEWNEAGTTFEDYSIHTLKFFYMERGGNISHCALRFNIPAIPDNSLTVTKTIDETAGVPEFAADAVSYTFRVVGENVDGLEYTIIENGAVVTDEDGEIITNKVNAAGEFTLKANQSAQFSNVPVTYSVQEKIGDEWVGKNEDEGNDFVKIEETTLDTAKYIVFTNKPETSSLEIKKEVVDTDNKIDDNAIFTFEVTIDGELVPVGTQYKLNGTTSTVSKLGELALKAGDTAVFENLPVGTTYKVEEIILEGAQYYAVPRNAEGTIEENGSVVTITNYAAETTSVLVTKDFVNDERRDEDDEFNFTYEVRLTSEADPINKVSFTLSENNNWEYEITGLPVGAVVTVTEDDSPWYSESNKVSVRYEAENANLTNTNMKANNNNASNGTYVGGITQSKIVTFSILGQSGYTMNLWQASYGGRSFGVVVNGNSPEIIVDKYTGSWGDKWDYVTASVQLADGVVNNVVVSVGNGTDAPNLDYIELVAEATGLTSTPVTLDGNADSITIDFTNEFVGETSVVIEKEVTGEDAPEGTEFTFDYEVKVNDETFKTGEVTLKDGEKKVIDKLPVGAVVTVKEENNPLYSTTYQVTAKYEAEDAILNGAKKLTNIDNTDIGNASGGSVVGDISQENGTATFTIKDAVEGTYKLDIRYATSQDRGFKITVNDDNENPIFTDRLNSSGWHNWNSETPLASVDVNLDDGDNKLVFNGNSDINVNAPNLDYIILTSPVVGDKENENGKSATITLANENTITFTNEYHVAKVTVEKKLENPADTVEIGQFKFTATVKVGDEQFGEPIEFSLPTESGEWTYSFDVPVGATVVVTEADDSTYPITFVGINGTATVENKTIEVVTPTSILFTNYKVSKLPSTGGIGTTIFYIVGSVIILSAGVLLIKKRRMNVNN